MTRERLFHITTVVEAVAARTRGEYRPMRFDREGFVHCSFERQVLATAARIFHGRQGLALLEIDPGALQCDVVEENLEGGSELYPHVYGPLPMRAVRAIHPFPPHADGSFSLPAAVSRDGNRQGREPPA